MTPEAEILQASNLLRDTTRTVEGVILGPLLHLIATIDADDPDSVMRIKQAALLGAQMLNGEPE